MNENFNNINKIISNKVISDKEKYALMIGLNPSKGARSPSLWNKFFNQSGIDAEMYPADLESEEKLIDLLKILETDNNFIGGAVAAPYKQTVYNFFKQNCDDLSSKASFASNNIFRNNKGILTVANTDAAAAVLSIDNEIKSHPNILLLGMGSTGRSIAAILKDKCELTVWNRSKNDTLEIFLQRNKKIQSIDCLPCSLASFDLIINATLVGSNQFSFLDTILIGDDLVQTAKKSCLFFDINYDPPFSNHSDLFMKNGNKCLNGIRMNLLQACIAISNCYLNFTPEEIENILAKNVL